MSRLEVYRVDSREVYKIVKNNIESCRGKLILPSDDKYHSCASLDKVPNILSKGLLSKRLQRGSLSSEEERIFQDPFCVNGADAVSLSTMRPEVPFSEMYRDEDYYNSFYTPYPADFVISGKLKTAAVTTNYFNELLVDDRVGPEYFTGINVRVLREIQKIQNSKKSAEEKAAAIIKLNDDLRVAAVALDEFNKNRGGVPIPLMEDSNRQYVPLNELMTGTQYTNDGVIGLDIDKVSSLPKIHVK